MPIKRKIADGSHGSCNQNKGNLQISLVVIWLATRYCRLKAPTPRKPETVLVSRFHQQTPQFDCASYVSGCKLNEWREQSAGGNTMSLLPARKVKKEGGRIDGVCVPPTLCFAPRMPNRPTTRPAQNICEIYETCDFNLSGCPRPRRSSGKKAVEIPARSSLRTQEVSSNNPKT